MVKLDIVIWIGNYSCGFSFIARYWLPFCNFEDARDLVENEVMNYR
jgi:hypothetical protein